MLPPHIHTHTYTYIHTHMHTTANPVSLLYSIAGREGTSAQELHTGMYRVVQFSMMMLFITIISTLS